MVYVQDEIETVVCPFIDADDGRCASRFSLSRMDEAFELCLARHLSCVTYHQLLREARGETGKCATANIHLTIEGSSAAIAAGQRGLRATGT
jgi:uncharacterized protein CbrC (UPF0167 family)